MKKDNKMKKVKDALSINVGDTFYVVTQEPLSQKIKTDLKKAVITQHLVMVKEGLDENLTGMKLNNNFIVRVNRHQTSNIDDVIFEEAEALDVVNETNEKNLKEARKKLDEAEELYNTSKATFELYAGRDNLEYDKKGRDIRLDIHLSGKDDKKED